jgi:uncharacterized protein YhbP (UPF0306 family)
MSSPSTGFENILTKEMVIRFLAKYNQMAVATFGVFPWIATLYYTFDKNLNIYFLSDPETLHAKQIIQNPKVSVSIANSSQNINKPKRGLQISGIAEQISDIAKIRHAFNIWKSDLGVVNPKLTYKAITGKMFKITPKRIKLFDQELFKVADGKEPVLEL